MSILAIFEDRTVLAVDHRGNLMVNADQFPEGALDILNPFGLTELLAAMAPAPEIYLPDRPTLQAIYG